MEGRSGEGIEIEMQIGKGKENLSKGTRVERNGNIWAILCIVV